MDWSHSCFGKRKTALRCAPTPFAWNLTPYPDKGTEGAAGKRHHLSEGSLGRYNCRLARLQPGNQDSFIGIEALVGEQDVRVQLRQQRVRSIQIASLTTGEMKADQVAQGIDRGMNLGTQPAFAAADSLVGAPFFSAPALC